MVRIDVHYLGDLRCECTHGPSGSHLLTDAPVDNHGKGEAFSPTDLLATALGSCVLTVLGIVAQKRRLSLEGMRATVDKEMSVDMPRRVARLTIHVHVPLDEGDPSLEILKTAAHGCPVYQSVHPETEIDIQFHCHGAA